MKLIFIACAFILVTVLAGDVQIGARHLQFLGTATAALDSVANGAQYLQSQESYEAAITDTFSFSPRYVMVTIVDPRKGTKRLTCVTADILLWAISDEYNLHGVDEHMVQARQIAISNNSHAFRFENASALKNFPNLFAEDEFRLAKSRYESITTERLFNAYVFGADSAAFTGFPTEFDREKQACVLIDRGLSPYEAHDVRSLNVARARQRIAGE